jgi:hypothetical protein
MNGEKKMSIILVDDAKYNFRKPKNEAELEEIVKEHSKQIFGHESLYFDIKGKIDSKTGAGSKPDGYAISFYEPKWYVVEVEVSWHKPYDHILPQITRFINGIKNLDSQKEISEWLYERIRENPKTKNFVEKMITEEISHFLTRLISKPPTVVIIVDEKTPQLEEACGKLEPEIIELKTFTRGVGHHAYAHLVCEPVEEDTHAKYDEREKGFYCLMCEKQDRIYKVGEINKHLMEKHDIDWDDQTMDEWSPKFEKQAKAYMSKKKDKLGIQK